MPKIKFTIPPQVAGYKKQMDFITCPERFTVVEATTKAGKTVGCVVWLYKEATEAVDGDNCWWIAPIYAQAKIAYRRMKRYIQPKSIFTANDSEMSIKLCNGVTIFFKSGDNPDSLYGDDVVACVIDEASRCKEEVWAAVVSVTTATTGKVKIIGNVKGVQNWAYKLAREAEKGRPNWAYSKITAADAIEAGILSQEVIDEAERSLPRGIFLELYYAIPFVNNSNKYAYSYEPEKHIGTTKYSSTHPLYLSFDFNKNPICCSMFQHYDNKILGIETIKLENSNIYQLCQTIKIKYPHAMFIVTGDATGKAGSAMVQDNLNYYKIIKAQLGLGSGQMQQPTVNPKVSENQVLVNAVLEHMDVKLDPTNCKHLIFDLQFVEMLPDGSIKKGNREKVEEQADALDTFRYYLNRYHRWILKQMMMDAA